MSFTGIVTLSVGETLMVLRVRKGLSISEAAKIAGIHRNYAGAIERGEANVTLSTLSAYARALGCELRVNMNEVTP